MKRQGDLLFVEVTHIPDDAVKQDHGVIAEGEITGHKHQISEGTQAVLMIAAGVSYINAIREAAIEHEEHNTVVLPPGQWEVRRQREYEPSGWRQVAD